MVIDVHKWYQQIRAYADGWTIEQIHPVLGEWQIEPYPVFIEHRETRIVPDAGGWVPWYSYDAVEPPVAGSCQVKTRLGWSVVRDAFQWQDEMITHYRPQQ